MILAVVLEPTIPSAYKLYLFWNLRTADFVPLPYTPSTDNEVLKFEFRKP
jgi:hypothetical protein